MQFTGSLPLFYANMLAAIMAFHAQADRQLRRSTTYKFFTIKDFEDFGCSKGYHRDTIYSTESCQESQHQITGPKYYMMHCSEDGLTFSFVFYSDDSCKTSTGGHFDGQTNKCYEGGDYDYTYFEYACGNQPPPPPRPPMGKCRISGPSYNTTGNGNVPVIPAPGAPAVTKAANATECGNLCLQHWTCDGFEFYGKGDPHEGDCYLQDLVYRLSGPLHDGRERYAGRCHPHPPNEATPRKRQINITIV